MTDSAAQTASLTVSLQHLHTRARLDLAALRDAARGAVTGAVSSWNAEKMALTGELAEARLTAVAAAPTLTTPLVTPRATSMTSSMSTSGAANSSGLGPTSASASRTPSLTPSLTPSSSAVNLRGTRAARVIR